MFFQDLQEGFFVIFGPIIAYCLLPILLASGLGLGFITFIRRVYTARRGGQ